MPTARPSHYDATIQQGASFTCCEEEGGAALFCGALFFNEKIFDAFTLKPLNGEKGALLPDGAVET